LKAGDSPSNSGVWDRELDSGRKGAAIIGSRKDRGTTGRRTILRALLVVAAIPLGLLVLSFFGLFPWSGINCTQSDIDLNSGRLRSTRYLLWLPVTRSVRDSALTSALSTRGTCRCHDRSVEIRPPRGVRGLIATSTKSPQEVS
jgi:hypothetical protein